MVRHLSKPASDPGLLATITWAGMDAFAERERVKCLQFAAWWRERGTPFAIQAAEYNEARAARLAAILGRHAQDEATAAAMNKEQP
jgi:hypothetical protein